MPEPPESADVAISPSMQDSITIRTAESPNPQVFGGDREPVSINSAPADQDLNREEKGSSVKEAPAPLTTASERTPETPPPDEEHEPPFLWCRVELKDPTQWAKCVMFGNSGETQRHRPLVDPHIDTRTLERNKLCEDVALNSPLAKPPAVIYSNRFVDRWDRVITVHPWPEALDLDHERGKPAGWKLRYHRPIIKLVTIVKTNIEINYMRPDSYRDTQAILSDPRVAAEFVRREVVIDSVRVVNAFKAIITYYPGLELRGITMTIPEPYCVFYHYHQEITALQTTLDASTDRPVGEEQPDTTQIGHETNRKERMEHLKALCDFIEGQNLEDVELERKRHQQNPPVATYRMMWLLFKPGTRIYHFGSGRAIAGVVISVETDSGSQRPGLRSLKYWSLDFDGFKLGRRELSHNFRPFDGEKRISELPVCPCEVYDAQDNNCLREKLICRGKRFWRFLPGVQVDYEGKLPNEAIEWVSSLLVSRIICQKKTSTLHDANEVCD